jgi:hypothetical protein
MPLMTPSLTAPGPADRVHKWHVAIKFSTHAEERKMTLEPKTVPSRHSPPSHVYVSVLSLLFLLVMMPGGLTGAG